MATVRFRLTPLEPAAVTLAGGLLAERQATNRRATIPAGYRQCKQTGRIDIFTLKTKPRQPFWGSDVAKWLEAAAVSLQTHPDKKLRRQVDNVVDLIVSAQQPDGYLNMWFTTVDPDGRWRDLSGAHELYSAGHLMEAAVEHHRATGERHFLDAMCRFADYIGEVFGPKPGQIRGYPGHQEIELALVKLHRATGRKKYLKLSKFFLDERGSEPNFFRAQREALGQPPKPLRYWQAHAPVRQQATAEGHAVRAVYMYAGMADVAAETGDAESLSACKRIWKNIVTRRMYITGGIGSQARDECFTRDYHLPNETAYAETCASIALMFFAHRMLNIAADGQYADVLERALYNGVLSGLSLAGTKFFYANPLAVWPDAGIETNVHVTSQRQDWFNVCCCPTNIVRLIAALGRYVYATAPGAVYVHLYAAGRAVAQIKGRTVTLTQRTDYPWSGAVRITVDVDAPQTFSLMLRIPGWCRKHAIKVNGRKAAAPVTKGYARIRRRWSEGDTVELAMDMPVERVAAHPKVVACAGRTALQRGPIVYCLEQCDHDVDLATISLPDNAPLTAKFDAELLGGCVVVSGTGRAVATASRPGQLYVRGQDVKRSRVRIRAVPYFLWCNRKPDAMTVWLPRT